MATFPPTVATVRLPGRTGVFGAVTTALKVNDRLWLGSFRGDRVAILSENRPEWALTDLACQMIGLATVPIYNSLTSDEIRYILEDSGSRVIAVSNRGLFEKIIPIQKQLPALRCVIAFDNALTAYADQVSIPVQAMRDIRPAEHSLTEDFDPKEKPGQILNLAADFLAFLAVQE
jgi:long-subunit acyl-CoA synthetase (AMP-forming)